jgi:hypothetical protein
MSVHLRSILRSALGLACIASTIVAAAHCGGQASMVCSSCSGASDSGANGAIDGGNGAMTCPANEPDGSDPCAGEGLACWYGDSGRPSCRDIWSCISGKWKSVRSGCAQLPSGFCPMSEPDGGVPCEAVSDPSSRGDCVYGGGVLCACPCAQVVTDAGAFTCGPAQFVCYGPPTTPGCPPTAPNIGTPCSVQGTQCVYGNACDVDGLTVLCRAGFWSLGNAICPT